MFNSLLLFHLQNSAHRFADTIYALLQHVQFESFNGTYVSF